ncbi:MAG: ester cyclase [Bacteroidota bacterium]
MVASVFLMLSVLSCNSVSQETQEVDYKTVEKEQIIEEFYRIWDAADVDAFQKIMSKDLIDHEREEKDDKSDYQNMVDATLYIHSGFSEVKHIPLQTHYLKDDKVLVYWLHTATHIGDFAGFSPTNKPVKMKGVDIFQLNNGKITEIWHVEAIHEILAQIRS